MLCTPDLFDLTNFDYADLFGSAEPWNAIKELFNYLQNNVTGEIEGEIHPSAVIDENVSIGSGTVVGPNTIIRGPTIIGRDCYIGSSLIRNALISTGSVIGYSCEVARSILLNGSQVSHLVFVGDSILGKRVNLGGGTHLSNLKLGGFEISIKHKAQRHPTGLTKLGSLIGDDCKLGAMCQTNPGTILSKECHVWPGARLHGWYPPSSQVKVFQTHEVVTS